ncbi:uncharacterized protein LOC130739394 [Lotus japonicus]|uniref:uncharacterized protein LOC130739394 n=1 Tax=Lotus japonicus TaxID=34305 RepID=UPI002589F1BD|nr:uncharacterized protein LOC130739394 [Lotus japonicus]
MEITDVHHGYFMVRFDVEADRERAVTGAPWLIYDHYLSVKPWTKDFVAADDRINTTMAWIRIPGLGMQFYDEDILMTLATGVGTPTKVDMTTADMRLGKFARICVEIDLEKPVVGMLRLRGVWYNIEYEGLHLLCSKCGCYGHMSRKCKVIAAETVAAASSTPATKATAPSAQSGTTLEAATDPAINADSMQAENSAPKTAASVPIAAHGKWLIVERSKRKQNQNRQSGGAAAKSKEGSNANRFHSLAKLQERGTEPVIGGVTGGAMIVYDGSKKSYSTETANAKKRSRRDEGKTSQALVQPPLRILERQSSQQTRTLAREQTTGSASGKPKTRMVGNKVVFDLGGGAMSTENMKALGGDRYQLFEDDAATTVCVGGELAATNPQNPGPNNRMIIVPRQ